MPHRPGGFGTATRDVLSLARIRQRRKAVAAPPKPKVTPTPAPPLLRGGLQQDAGPRIRTSIFTTAQRSVDERIRANAGLPVVTGGPTIREFTPLEEYLTTGTVQGRDPFAGDVDRLTEAAVDTTRDGNGDGNGGGDGGPGAGPAEPEIPKWESLPLGLLAPDWYILNPDWKKVPAESRQFLSTLDRLLPLFGVEDVPFIAGLISSIGGTQFARYGEATVQPNFVLPDEAGGGTPDIRMRLTAASGLLGPLAPAARNLGQGLLPMALGSIGTRAARIGGHRDIQSLLESSRQNPFAAILQRLVEPSAMRPAPGSMAFTRFGPKVVKNPAFFV